MVHAENSIQLQCALTVFLFKNKTRIVVANYATILFMYVMCLNLVPNYLINETLIAPV